MLRNKKGFTLVELLIVIVVIAILAAITIVAYNGVQSRARNVARVSELQQWAKLITMYRTQNGQDPQLTAPLATTYCLGTGFSGNACWNPNGSPVSAPSATLNAALATMGTLPNNADVRKPIASNGNSVGPLVDYDNTDTSNQKITTVWAFFEGNDACPSNTTQRWRTTGQYACNLAISN